MTRTMAASLVPAGLLALALVSPTGAFAEEVEGKAKFLGAKCNLCHGVPAAEIVAKTESEKMKGPELGGKLPKEIPLDKLKAFLRKEVELDGKQHKKEFKGTDEELQAILDWLGSLEAAEAAEAGG